MTQDLNRRYPSVAHLEARARRRMPGFLHDYMTGGIGPETGLKRNRETLDGVMLMPRYLEEADRPDLSASLFGRRYDAPFAVAPIGLAGLQWPSSEAPRAVAARAHNIPFVLSTFSNISMEDLRPIAGENAWFQFYPPNDADMEADMLRRAREAGYDVLVLTVDIPVPTRRVRDIRNGLSFPPVFDLKTVFQIAMRPSWALQILKSGIPAFGNLAPYYPKGSTLRQSAQFLSSVMTGHIGVERFKSIRDSWPGKLLVKGVLDPAEGRRYIALGADGLVVSNHGARQLDAAPSAAQMLPAFRQELGQDAVLIADGGIRSGLDIARMMALGANFVMIGRPFILASAAIGNARGTGHLIWLLKAELQATLGQLGCKTVVDLPGCLYRDGCASS